MTAEDIVRRFLKLWAAEDIDSAIRLVAEDAVYALYISKEAVPFGGETAGRSAIEACLREIRQRFEYLVFRPLSSWPTETGCACGSSSCTAIARAARS